MQYGHSLSLFYLNQASFTIFNNGGKDLEFNVSNNLETFALGETINTYSSTLDNSFSF